MIAALKQSPDNQIGSVSVEGVLVVKAGAFLLGSLVEGKLSDSFG